jgi:hypothetical protein
MCFSNEANNIAHCFIVVGHGFKKSADLIDHFDQVCQHASFCVLQQQMVSGIAHALLHRAKNRPM